MDFPIKHGDFPVPYVNVYQAGYPTSVEFRYGYPLTKHPPDETPDETPRTAHPAGEFLRSLLRRHGLVHWTNFRSHQDFTNLENGL